MYRALRAPRLDRGRQSTCRRGASAGIAAIAAVAAVTALAGCSHDGATTTGSTTAVSTHAGTASTRPAAASSTALPTGLPTGDADATAPAPAATSVTSAPAAISIASIGVHSALQPLGLEKDGSLQAPTKWQVAGWYADGVRPGDPGPAVIAGHVDSVNGPAVFSKLTQVKPGQSVTVTQRSGHKLAFVVDTVTRYPKNEFPTAAVYGPTPLPVLRLVTCTGDFNTTTHHYVDNLVVSAHLQARTPFSTVPTTK